MSRPTVRELLPCPFCGGEAVESMGSKGGEPWPYIECLDCAATCETAEEWNRRLPAAALERLEALEKALRDPRVQYDVKDAPGGWRALHAYTNGEAVVLCGHPGVDDESHNCDAMGCGSVGAHTLHYVGLAAPTPAAEAHGELAFNPGTVLPGEYAAGDLIRKAVDYDRSAGRFYLTCSIGELAQRIAAATPTPAGQEANDCAPPYTPEQLEAAARELTRRRGFDPDQEIYHVAAIADGFMASATRKPRWVWAARELSDSPWMMDGLLPAPAGQEATQR